MNGCDDDPLDLLGDDDDGVIDAILFLDEDEEARPAPRSGSSGCLIALAAPALLLAAGFGLIRLVT